MINELLNTENCKEERENIFQASFDVYLMYFGATTSLSYIRTVLCIFSNSHYFPILLNKHLFAHPSSLPPPHKKWKSFLCSFFLWLLIWDVVVVCGSLFGNNHESNKSAKQQITNGDHPYWVIIQISFLDFWQSQRFELNLEWSFIFFISMVSLFFDLQKERYKTCFIYRSRRFLNKLNQTADLK